MTEIEAIERIGASTFNAISTCWKKAWDDIRGPWNHPDYSSRVRSSLLQEHASIHGMTLLPPFGVQVFNEHTQRLFIIPNVACLVFKKLDEHRAPSKNETDREKKLYQSLLFDYLPTLVTGMVTDQNWFSYVGIYLFKPNESGMGKSWELNITNDPLALDADQSNFLSQIDESDEEQTTQTTPKPKFTPKHDIGESSEEAGSGGDGG